MGLLKKWGLVEPADDGLEDFKELKEELPEPIPVNVPEETAETLVPDIYSENGMSDLSKSIFKVEELINSLPKEMPTAAKLTSVKAILGNFGILDGEVLEDSERRESILNAALSEIIDKMQCEISEKEQEIESYKEQISNLEKEISRLNGIMQNSEHLIESELDRIKKLREFIQGVG